MILSKKSIAYTGSQIKSRSILKQFKRDKYLLLIMLPVFIHLFIFSYIPIYGILLSFRKFNMGDPYITLGSDAHWVGLKNFIDFFKSIFFFRVMKNTLLNSTLSILFGFWIPIVFALLLNEIKHKLYKRVSQTLSYLPHFISAVIIVGMVINFVDKDGLLNNFIELLGGQRIQFMNQPQYFRLMYITTGIWQSFGWGAIIYLAAISSIDPGLYESAVIDGANAFRKIIHITIPGIIPTIVILLILSVGNILNSDTEKILLLYNTSIYETADVIGTYIYRVGLKELDYGYSTAVGMFASVINFGLLVVTNKISTKYTEYGLW